MDNKKPLVSTEELNALLGSWSERSSGNQVDKFFPLRFWFIAAFTVFGGMALLLNAEEIAMRLTSDENFSDRLRKMLYFRGWFVFTIILVGVYVYVRDKYIPLFSLIFLIVSISNLIFDMTVIFPDRFSEPTPFFTITLILRILAIWCVFLNFKNCFNIPKLQDRFNIRFTFAKN